MGRVQLLHKPHMILNHTSGGSEAEREAGGLFDLGL